MQVCSDIGLVFVFFISKDFKVVKKEALPVGVMDHFILRIEVGAKQSSGRGWGPMEIKYAV